MDDSVRFFYSAVTKIVICVNWLTLPEPFEPMALFPQATSDVVMIYGTDVIRLQADWVDKWGAMK